MGLGRIRTLYVAALVIAAVAIVFVFASGPGASASRQVADNVTVTAATAERPGLLVAGVALAVLAAVPMLAALVGAAVTAARARRWAWFIMLIVLPGITLLGYVLAAPQWAGGRPAPA